MCCFSKSSKKKQKNKTIPSKMTSSSLAQGMELMGSGFCTMRFIILKIELDSGEVTQRSVTVLDPCIRGTFLTYRILFNEAV